MLHTETTLWRHGGPAAGRRVPLQRAHTLIAEHDRDLREEIAVALEADGYTIATAEDGDQVARYLRLAFAGWQGFRVPDLVIFDVDLPGADAAGIVTRLYRADSALPVVLLAGAERIHPTVAHGAVQFTKPFDLDDLRTAALNLLPSIH